MKNKYLYSLALLFGLLCSGVGSLYAQTTVVIGSPTGSNNTSLPSPYYDDWTTNHQQYLITAAELNAAGLTGPCDIGKIEFNVQSISTSQICGGLTLGSVRNFSIKMKNTAVTAASTPLDLTGLTTVYTRSIHQAAPGWNVHIFDNNFTWDGVSNIIVDVCHDNTVVQSTCYNCCNYVYYTATKWTSCAYTYTDGAGSYCAVGQGVSYGTSGNRPDMRITSAPPANPFPPSPNFQFTLGTDTLWENAPSVLLNTSANSAKNYWNITQFSASSASGPWTPYSTLPKDTLQCNAWGCFIDTTRNDPNLQYYFPKRGYYKVSLTTVNNYGSNAIEKIVYVDTARTKPTASFFATRRQLGANDRVRMNNISSNAPARLKWWLENTCKTCPADTNRFLPNDSAFAPVLAAYTPGLYKVCLAVSNSKGSDTMCRSEYLRILPGYMMHHTEPGRYDSVGRDDAGYLYSDLRTNDGTNLSGQFNISSNNNWGFRIAPCADTIYLTLERLRLRGPSVGAGDSVYVRLNGYNGPIVRRWGGNNISLLKDSSKVYKHIGQYLYIQYIPAVSTATPPPTMVNDSGFTLKWTSSPALYPKPVASFSCPDTLYSGYKVRFMNGTVGRGTAYAWDLNNDGAFGQDKPQIGVDSITLNPTITYTTTTNTTRKVCLKAANCQGNDTFCRILPLLPITAPPIADFVVSRTTGFISDTFQFIDKSQNGGLSWKWRFEPNNVTWLPGSDSTSQFPMVTLNSPQSYNVTLIITNPLGVGQITKNAIVNVIDYGSPGSAFPPVLDATDFGITRVVIKGADKTIDTTTALKTPTYTRLFSTLQTTVYRGGTYSIDVYRTTANDPQSLRIWADYNRDADYTDANETILGNEDNTQKVKTSVMFTVPGNAAIGNSRILIGACNSISAISPVSATVGVYEDYGMMIGNDFTKPTLTLKGGSNVATELGDVFVDSGATASDNIEGDISAKVQTISNLDVSHLGTYQIKYFVTDLYGNTSDTLVRTVHVVIDNNGPSISLIGADSITLNVFATFTEPGYHAEDNQHNDLSLLVQRSGNVDMSKLGTYTLTYTITDAYGLTAQTQRTVIVVDTECPVVRSYTKDTVVHQIGTPFEDAKYIEVVDNYYKNIIPSRTGPINANKPGVYLLTYVAVDGSGNSCGSYTLAVNVTNKVAPTIQLVGAEIVVLPVFGTYNDLGVVAYDYKGDPLTYTSDLNEKLRVDELGEDTITYMVADEYGLTASVTRRIQVKDVESPIVELLGDNPFVHPLGKPYSDPGVKVTDNFYGTVVTDHSMPNDPALTVLIDSSKVNVNGGGFYYMVYVTAIDGSGNRSEEKKRIVYISTTGINDVLQTEGYSLYPNPASTFVNIKLTKGEMLSFTAFDVQGKAINLTPVAADGNAYKMDVSKLNAGIYLFTLETKEGQVMNGKFSISK